MTAQALRSPGDGVSRPPERPLLVFDGECGFCRFWIERWRLRNGDVVDYAPSQQADVVSRFPEIPRERFARAVQLIETDGQITEGAEAVFRLLSIKGPQLPRWAYDHVPGVAPVTEWMYRSVADHRSFWATVTTSLWGRNSRPATYAWVSWLFLRVLGLVYFAAFWSLATQIVGLVGHDGILPADRYMAAARDLSGISRYWLIPTLTWFSASDAFLQGLCVAGVALSALLIAGILPRIVLSLLWLLYLSLSIVGRDFLSFQWDALLLETGLLAIALAPLVWRERMSGPREPLPLARWLLLWLLFRLMVGSGLVKLVSGDPTWRGLTALSVHFETQPIPTPLAWYANWLPSSVLQLLTALVLTVEIAAPFSMFGPRRVRRAGFALLAGLQVAIALTGNYAFFNLLTLALCLPLLDDDALGRWTRRRGSVSRQGWRGRWFVAAIAILTVPPATLAFTRSLGVEPPGAVLAEPLINLLEPFRSANSYGLFAVMTTTRPEIVVEGSMDGQSWMEYEFRYKAGDVHRRPPWVAPHQPRLDWQMWFAALSRFDEERWFQSFCVRLLEGDAAVLALLSSDPFEGHAPRYLRATLYRYRFADAETSRREGAWWTRQRLGEYSPVLSLQTQQ